MIRLLATLFLLCVPIIATPAFAQTIEDGWAAYDAGDYETAKSIFLSLADAGDAKAMNAIGLMHDEGNGYQEDSKLACDWYEKSAKAGYASGRRNIGLCFHEGIGRPLNHEKAAFWYELAANQNYVNAQITLVKLLAETDPEKATYWGQKAVNQGSAAARVTMWAFDLKNTGRPATELDIGCVMLMNYLLHKPLDYCD